MKMQLPRQKLFGLRWRQNWEKTVELYYFYLYPLQFARLSGVLIAALWD